MRTTRNFVRQLKSNWLCVLCARLLRPLCTTSQLNDRTSVCFCSSKINAFREMRISVMLSSTRERKEGEMRAMACDVFSGIMRTHYSRSTDTHRQNFISKIKFIVPSLALGRNKSISQSTQYKKIKPCFRQSSRDKRPPPKNLAHTSSLFSILFFALFRGAIA